MQRFLLNSFSEDKVQATYDVARIASKHGTASYQDDFAFAAEADLIREQALERMGFVEAACRYLVLAQKNAMVGKKDPERFFHFAANAFRDAGLLQHAAECYFNSALAGKDKLDTNLAADTVFAIRSAGRAKALFWEIGDSDMGDQAHVVQHRLKRLLCREQDQLLKAAILGAWDTLSEFGTSVNRWAKWFSGSIVVFAAAYAALLCGGYATTTVQHVGVGMVMASAYLSICNLFQFGTLGTLNPCSPIAQAVCVVHGVVAFLLLGTGATFLTKK